MEKYDAFLFDCDGVIWRGNDPVPGSIETLNLLKSQGKKIFFITNNSSKTRTEFSQKLSDLGFQANPNQLYSTSMAVPKYLKKHYPEVSKLFLIGMEGFKEELQKEGFQVVKESDLPKVRLSCFSELQNIEVDSSIDAVVTGSDMQFNYLSGCYACGLIQMGKKFLAACTDSYFVLKNGNMPGSGAILAFLEAASEQKAEVVGKPNSFMIDLVVEDWELDKSRCLMVGDRIDTDILFGTKAGIDTALVLTGASKEEDLQMFDFKPTYIYESVAKLFSS
mmetsp:Transcript_8057/g.11895  ORF Transcript_8057/g.11895 Transcript_8057/m.11895 type:complete len:278 (-) Transcript_8057:31-864(-)|eukprot:CAMPEP_0202435610 /NCGR_PEP_ID=MMETSP1345-20130828/20644_1 /ASSEMBLY_ACC=CAM_ASM_000843 /TAXON_ID=342563 /ORGANISM="Fabrea Fabrea salina" /LENGTH=277 /DNA_ID=CAMNT_0049048693 /DNA_START=389 /DNA_END=1222 /DNA_ORIENTATION=-